MIAPSNYIKKYNDLISREKKGFVYLENPDIPHVEKEKWLPEYAKITMALNEMIVILEKLMGRKMTKLEILNGISQN